MSWSAAQYSQFEHDRTRPVHDLLAAVPAAGVRVAVDLGCGPGNSTEVLAARYPAAAVSGVDSSPDMLAAARARLPGLAFALGDIADWHAAAPCDLLLSNAVLHWLPDHDTLLPRLVGQLAPGGHLAVQVPDNSDEPVQRFMRDVAMQGSWAASLAPALAARTPMGTADWFYRTLKPHCSQIDIWRTTYYPVLPGGAAAVVDWFKGSGLRPFLSRLTEAEGATFIARYQAMVAAELPPMPDGSVLLPFPRLFIVGRR